MSAHPNRALRVLVVGLRPPHLPLRDGYVLHLYHLLSQLHAEEVVTFLSIDDGTPPFDGIDGLEVLVTPHSKLRARLRMEIQRLGPDIVHLVGAPLAVAIPSGGRHATLLGALDAPHLNVDAVEAGNIIEATRKRAKRAMLIRSIRKHYGSADRVVVVSAEDATALQAINPGLATSVIPNGVDLYRFAPRPDIEREPGRLLFTGALDYAPNIATAVFLAEQVLPLVRATEPTARLALVGRDPAAPVLELSALEGVDVIGPVEDMGDALATGAVYLCPMVSGTGIKNKLLEALANGVACVASTLAVRGTSLTDGDNVLIANTPEEVANAALRLLHDESLRKKLGDAGRVYVSEHHTWSSMALRYQEIYKQLVNGSET